MIANKLLGVLKHSNSPLLGLNSNVIKACIFASVKSFTSRSLYSKATLGLEAFDNQRQTTQNQMENIIPKFKDKMSEYVTEGSNHMVFTEDLKNMIHISNEDKDLDLVGKMIRKFNQQNKEMRFGSYIFGPVVLRLFHHFNKPHIALECFKSPELAGFFDQLISYQILLDLLYENHMYKEVLECVDIIKSRQIDGMKYPKNIIVLAMAACYKLNTKESLDCALKMWQEIKEVGHFPMRRATTFCAGLALNQGNPGVALEVLTSARNQHYTTVRNLKVACLAEVGRVENAIPLLKSVMSEDAPSNVRHTFNKEVIDRVRNAVTKLDNPEVAVEFNRIEQMFLKLGHISDTTLDEQLCQEIMPPQMMNNRQNSWGNQQQPRFRGQQGEQRTYTNKKYYTFRQRPGLDELV
ncbi:unnamed protein product [Phaedon cochleariae]|uniref:Pentatricopeptide repeat-containing protein 2 n=1 Tax=Phaedon cochleariae TaxID=80249 RepID=A0A9N9SAY8_PHACE|nr:unnamed protein product [Phaedon cochleariae]